MSAARPAWRLAVLALFAIAYYIALYALLRWPQNVATLDLLFLIPPGPWWIQLVWVPVAISGLLVAAGSRLFAATGRRREG